MQLEKYFRELATPSETNNANFARANLSTIQNNIVIDLESSSADIIQPISREEVQKAIKDLNNGKAADANGISTKRLKCAGTEIKIVLTQIFNRLLKDKDITLKEGILTPILRKGKDKTIPLNYRGITVTNVLSKVFEAILKTDMRLSSKQNPLQRGFTAGVSPLGAPLLVTEAIVDAKRKTKRAYSW